MYHPPPCITTRRCALGSFPRSPPEALAASPAVAEGAMAAPRRTTRLLLQTPRAPAPLLLPRHHHTTVDERRPTVTSPTRTQWTQVRRRKRRRRMQALLGRAPTTRCKRTVAAARLTSTHSAAVLPMSLNSCILSIKDFVAKLVRQYNLVT